MLHRGDDNGIVDIALKVKPSSTALSLWVLPLTALIPSAAACVKQNYFDDAMVCATRSVRSQSVSSFSRATAELISSAAERRKETPEGV